MAANLDAWDHFSEAEEVKRGIFKRLSIDVCIEHGVLATPITPAALPFSVGEEMVVATTKAEAPHGEYQFLFTMGDYLGEDSARAGELFDRPDWKQLYSVASITTIEPFKLTDVVEAAGDRGPEVEYRYKGQTQHHRIIRSIWPEDEPLWQSFIEPGTEPAVSALAVVEANSAQSSVRRARELSLSQIVARLRRMDGQNKRIPRGRTYRPRKSQARNREFTALIKALYEGRCQVCGDRIANPEETRTALNVHHLEPWDGDRSDRLDNVICVCPNDHARFELGVLRWSAGGLAEWTGSAWVSVPLSADKHLLVRLRRP